MTNSESKLASLIANLQKKYEVMGQDMSSYLEGLLHTNYLTYWNYIHLDTLLSLQEPRTNLKDEKIFITYHQITELYFQLILWELEQIIEKQQPNEQWACDRIYRIVRYVKSMVDSFDVMIKGMERDQFLKFRMSLLPSSGFQSVQYRLIEFMATDVHQLVIAPKGEPFPETLAGMMKHLYWKQGAIELETGKKTLTLKQFEKKYKLVLEKAGRNNRKNNLRQWYQAHLPNSSSTKKALRTLDQSLNIMWPMAHLKATSNFLQTSTKEIKATGGTNWKTYLSSRFRTIIFYPELWTKKEIKNWGPALHL